MKVAIVGMRFRENYDSIQMISSNKYLLELERDNEHDRNAIKVSYYFENDSIHCGYIAREYNQDKNLRRMIRNNNYELCIQSLNDKVIIGIVSPLKK